MEKIHHIKLINTNVKRQAREFLLSVAELPVVQVASMTDERVGVVLAEWCNENNFGVANALTKNGQELVLYPNDTSHVFAK